MAGDGGLNALSLLPENELPQWQQKIALRAENTPRPYHLISGAGGIFCAFAQFFAGIGPAHFLAETTRPLGRGCLPFSPTFENSQILDK